MFPFQFFTICSQSENGSAHTNNVGFLFLHSYSVCLRPNFIFLNFYYQLILIIHGFHICEFTHLLKLMCNLKINISLTFTVTHGYASSGEKLSHLLHTFPAEVKQGQALLSCFRSLQTNVPFTIYLVLYFLQFYAFCW